MSQLRADLLSNRAGNKPPTVIKGSFINGYNHYNGATNTSNDSLNVSSMTDNGVGNHTTWWASAFSNAAYNVVSGQSHQSGTTRVVFGSIEGAVASGVIFTTVATTSANAYDDFNARIAAMGILA